MILTRELAIDLTKDLWTWVSERDWRHKDSWPRWEKNGGDIHRMLHACPCCHYVNVLNKSRYAPVQACERYCPLDWPGGRCTHHDDTGLYDQWLIARLKQEFGTATKIAKQIANLQEVEE